MRTFVLLGVLLVALPGCDHGLLESDRLAREGALQAVALSFAPSPPQPPPPPPPPPPPEPPRDDLPPPVEITEFLRAQANEPGPWKVTLYQLPDGRTRRRPRFMGRHARRRRVLGPEMSAELVARLSQNLYSDGFCACWTSSSLGIRIARGSAKLDLAYNTGRLFLTPNWSDDGYVAVGEANGAWLEELRRRVGI